MKWLSIKFFFQPNKMTSNAMFPWHEVLNRKHWNSSVHPFAHYQSACICCAECILCIYYQSILFSLNDIINDLHTYNLAFTFDQPFRWLKYSQEYVHILSWYDWNMVNDTAFPMLLLNAKLGWFPSCWCLSITGIPSQGMVFNKMMHSANSRNIVPPSSTGWGYLSHVRLQNLYWLCTK